MKNPVIVSAQFAAYVWFTNQNAGSPTVEKDAVAFARENWRTFLPSAHKGLGRLLLRISGPRSRRRRRARPTAFAG